MRCSCGLCARCTYLNRQAERRQAHPRPVTATERPRRKVHRPRVGQPKRYIPTGRPPGRPPVISDDVVRRAAELHAHGMTWRELGSYFGVDYSGLSRRVRAMILASDETAS